MKLWMPALATLTLALAACDAPSAPEAPASEAPAAAPAPAATTSTAAFSHTATIDQSGYFMPMSEVTVGSFRLDHMFLGQAFEFDSWETGAREAFAPVMLHFDDTSSPTVTNEMGGEGHTVTVRVLPTSYDVTDETIGFAGTSPELGAVSFEGRLDTGALATARRNLGEDEAVLTGTLQIGERRFADQRFRWYGGD